MDNLIYNVTIFADDAEWFGTICQTNMLTVSLIVTYLEKISFTICQSLRAFGCK
jgi:hypothetical protein